MTVTPPTSVVGTAGHVDHGKSTLVKALTGIDPDRLREEKEREMTIDLGFAWLTLPSGRRVSMIDVPGHERFIRNMLAGVGGFDAALLVIAADEGPMPQTREHLAILDLLEIRQGIVAITKRDLVEPDWLELVMNETIELLQGTTLEGAPLIPVSAITGEGLAELIQTLDTLLATLPPHPADGKPRLAVDRVFTIAGFGTVVTGTLRDGPLSVGQEIEILPAGKRGRIRGLQRHREKVEHASPGARTAVNISGIAVEEISRGDVLTIPGWLTPTQRIDARIRLLADAPAILEQDDEVMLFIGTSETLAQLTLLDAEKLTPGDTGWVQLRLRKPVVAVRGDRFILRRPSPSATLGGGVVVDAHPPRHRRFHPATIATLELLARGEPVELVRHALAEEPRDVATLTRQLTLHEHHVADALEVLQAQGEIIALVSPTPHTPTLYLQREALEAWRSRLVALLADYHQQYPLRRGMPKEAARSQLEIAPRAFDALVATFAGMGAIVDDGDVLRLPTHAIQLTPQQEAAAQRLLAALHETPYTPPSPSTLGVDPELVNALIELGYIVRVDEDIVFPTDVMQEIEQTVLTLIDANNGLTLAQFRDHFNTSRKYAQAVLEYLDRKRVTRRVGDVRVRYAQPQS
ncbi:selenocysteine-specific translation elongation factor [Thermorudis peleae]|uniref:selenocysteine-specific translation elongation factor n=1 Tax=Thermorudis peleae TaxID=1382356 RepID=UPI00056F6211|nr:selenocysteine-specific translation elongation factor [Thermorudis peleae]